MTRSALIVLGAAFAALVHAAPEPAPEPAPDALLPTVLVVGATPILGAQLDRDRVPTSTWVLDSRDIDRTGIPSLKTAILERIPSAAVNDTDGNEFQPDVLFRGFTASPVAGTPQGLAIYVNGARFNDAFGDTVNWDLIPPQAIDSVNLEASNPLFGLNALGGSLNVKLKDGFSDAQDAASLYGGSYQRGAGIFQYQGRDGPIAIYVAADATHDGGFRYTEASDLYRLYTDVGYRDAGSELHLAVLGARTTLGNPGATPEQALDASIANIFTAPNVVDNTYGSLNLRGTQSLAGRLALQGVAYFQTLNQVIPNGTTAEVQPCDNGTGLLCNDDGTVVTTFGGASVPDFLHGATYSGLSVQELTTHAYGASLQMSDDAPIGGHGNYLLGGASFDGSHSLYAGVAELGGFNAYTRDFAAPGIVQDQPGEGVNPVRVASTTQAYGLFATDVFTILPALDVDVAGRFNAAQTELTDELGGPVHGNHHFNRFDPSAGFTYRASTLWQFYANYAETNRAPTPQELSCASPAAPCSLLNFFVGDPDLEQVVARTEELGVRGHTDAPAPVALTWNVDAYHTSSSNDIIYEVTTYNPNLAFYTNAGHTVREGLEASVRLDTGPWHASVGYAFTEAEFQSPLLLGTNSPAANANGEEQVLPGARIPGIPRHRVNLVLDVEATPRVRVGGSVETQSNAYRFGDEANLTAPLGGYTLVDLNASYRAGAHLTLFAAINNVFDKRYYTYGSFGPVGDTPWPNVRGGVTDPRTASPGMPLAAYGGVRITF